jgi:prevent-host-death family protein
MPQPDAWPAPSRLLDAAAAVVTLVVMSEAMPLAALKAHLSEVVDRVIRTHERVTITRHGRREAVIIAPEDLDALEETLETALADRLLVGRR